MRTPIPLYSLLLLIVLSACQSEGEKATAYTHGLTATDKQRAFELDNRTSYHSVYFYTHEEDGELYYIWGNMESIKSNPTIQFFDARRGGKQKFEIVLPLEGPKGINQFLGLYIHNLDSIFVSGGMSYRILLFDKAGKLKDIYPFYTVEDTSKAYMKALKKQLYNGPMPKAIGEVALKKKDSLHFPIMDNQKPYSDEAGYFSKNKFISINLKNKGMQMHLNLEGDCAAYDDRAWGQYYVKTKSTQTIDNNSIVFSYGMDEHIYVNDLEGNPSQSYYAGSQYFDNISEEWTPDRKDIFYLENPAYRDIIPDKYREVYYRLAYQGLPSGTDENGNPLNFTYYYKKKPASVIILDKNFNKIGETKLPKEIYAHNYFVTEEGLWFSEMQEDVNPDLDEDVMTYRLFELIEI
ncbi:MAG: DUF4221 family protein [Bernardetiaceae bacterium]|nr:DUF4221 family protein [Bernardetiaceae bacterium]